MTNGRFFVWSQNAPVIVLFVSGVSLFLNNPALTPHIYIYIYIYISIAKLTVVQYTARGITAKYSLYAEDNSLDFEFVGFFQYILSCRWNTDQSF